MLHTIFDRIHKHLIQTKGRDITWIHTLSSTIGFCHNSVYVLKKHLKTWRHILTASRSGNEEVRLKHSLNMFAKFVLVAGYFLFWYFLSKFIFTDFHPFSYWNINGNFWSSILWISTPVIIYAFSYGQLDWFGTGDDYEEGTLIAESIPFKWSVSLVAGVTEELTHRSLIIFVGLISIYISNLFFVWILGIAIFFVALFVLAKIEAPAKIAFPLLAFTVIALIISSKYLPENPVYVLNEYIFHFLQWITSNKIRLALFLFVLMTCARLINVARIHKKVPDYKISNTELITVIIIFTIFGTYCMPLGVEAIATMPIIPKDADHWTTILYISAALWSNAKFRDGHKYQGPAGMMDSYVFGIYMYYIAFTYGLLYAIVVHAIFDAVLFSSEHICQVWKNRHVLSLN